MTKKEQEELKRQNLLYKKVKEASDKKSKELRFWERRAEHWGRLKADKDRELDKMAVELRHSQALCGILLEKLGGKTSVEGKEWQEAIREGRDVTACTDEKGSFTFFIAGDKVKEEG